MHIDKLKYILVFSLLALVSCNDEEDLPDEPVINTVSFTDEDKTLLVNFTDGDGNFGLAPGDTLPPFQELVDTVDNEVNDFHYNLWVDLYVQENGIYQLVQIPGTFDFRVPVLTPSGQNKQLRVNITYDLAFDLDNLGGIQKGDTMRFDVVLVDRDLNLSNVATTEGHILQ